MPPGGFGPLGNIKQSGNAVTKLEQLFFQVSTWTQSEKSRFYRSLSLNMTIAIRSIWSDDTLADQEKIERIKWINEVHHRLINHMADLAHEKPLERDSDVWEMVQDYAQECPAIKGQLGQAIVSAFDGIGEGTIIDCRFCGKIMAGSVQDTDEARPTPEEMYRAGNVPIPNFGWFCSQECASRYEKTARVQFRRNQDDRVDYYNEN